MKQRIITALAAGGLPILALVFLQTPVLGVLLVPFAAIACYEILTAAQMKNKPMLVASMAVAGLVPVLCDSTLLGGRFELPLFPLLLGWLFLLVILMLARFDQTPFAHLLFALLGSLVVPLAFSSLVLIRQHIQGSAAYEQMNLARYFLFFALCCAWLTDACAYFVGRKFGKRKLSPKISPKKSVEGAVGGIVLTALLNVGLAALCNAFFLVNYELNLLAVGLLSLPLCVISMVGDLAASVLKRNYNIKDYGKLFPGMGGVMDRFDSVLFVAPMVLALLELAQRYAPELLFACIKCGA